MSEPYSVLFPPDEPRPRLQHEPPPFFQDLLLDQVVEAVTATEDLVSAYPRRRAFLVA